VPPRAQNASGGSPVQIEVWSIWQPSSEYAPRESVSEEFLCERELRKNQVPGAITWPRSSIFRVVFPAR
jgi:hypothetical protein